MKPLSISLLFLLVQAPALYAHEEAPATAADPAPDCEQAMTVFHDVSGVGRKDRAAANMTRRHERMAGDRWRFADMEAYTENGDLEGFFLTYVRSVACPAATEGD